MAERFTPCLDLAQDLVPIKQKGQGREFERTLIVKQISVDIPHQSYWPGQGMSCKRRAAVFKLPLMAQGVEGGELT